MVFVSPLLIQTLKLCQMPHYKLARRHARCHPSTFSKMIHGAERLKDNDPRIVAVGKALGLTPEECFSEEPDVTAEVA